MTPVHHAAAAGCLQSCEVLVRAGANADAWDSQARDPLACVPAHLASTAAERAAWQRALRGAAVPRHCGAGGFYPATGVPRDMGVTGLLTFLRKQVNPELVELQLDAEAHCGERTLVLDLTSFCIWVFKECYAPGVAKRGCDLSFAAAYGDAQELVAEFAGALARYGLRLEAVADCPAGSQGLDELESAADEICKRGKERRAVAKRLVQVLEGVLSSHEFQSGDLPMPFLFARAVAAGLREAGVQIATAAGEADDLIGHRMRARRGLYLGVFGNDADFAVMRGCRLVANELFQLGSAASAGFPSLARLVADSTSPTAELWEVHLEDPGDRHQLQRVWADVWWCYGHGEECCEKGLDLNDVSPEGTAVSQFVHRAVCRGVWPLWAWPVHLHGLHVLPAVSDWCSPSALQELLRPLWETAYALLRAEGSSMVRISPADSGLKRQPWDGQRLPLLDVAGLPMDEKLRIWRLAAGGDARAAAERAAEAVRKPPNSDVAAAEAPKQLHVEQQGATSVALDAILEVLVGCDEGWSLAAAIVPAASKHLPDAGSLQRTIKEAGGLRRFCDAHADYLVFDPCDSGGFVSLVGAVRTLIWNIDKRDGALPFAAIQRIIYPRDPGCKEAVHAAGGLEAFCRTHAYALTSDGKSVRRATPGALVPGVRRASSGGPPAPSTPDPQAHSGAAAPAAREDAGRTAAVLALAAVARSGSAGPLGVWEEDFDALVLMAVLLHQQASGGLPREEEGLGEGEDESLLPLALLGERYQRIAWTIAEVGELLGARGPTCAVTPQQLAEWKRWREEAGLGALACSGGAPLARRPRRGRAAAGEPQRALGAEAGRGQHAESGEHKASGEGDAGVHVLRHLRSGRVVCVNGATGCGKSTQVPQYLLEVAPDANIVVAQPRRMAAIQLAKRVASERGEELGQTVGYAIGGGDSTRNQATRLTFVTTGYLLQLLVHKSAELKKLTHVVLDEVHERSVDADMLSLVIKTLLGMYTSVSLVIMSATMNASIFQEHMNITWVVTPLLYTYIIL
ncbi:unnamed protein product [Prorocentrum cordatum]|uniref:Helicase ATP-binding domain-containing protein n=1 Tax=Prorocentrum cordatum TaxID=2364126 RepID=A0ABN9PS61_9DINO|nr:unnamed protein product [Polarella glacialis]